MPCLTLPAGEGPDGLPVGIQLVGRRHDDAKLLDVALWVERTSGGTAMTTSRPNRLSAADAIAQLASGALTAEALTRACLDRAAERASVKAWIWLDPEQALAQAREADRAGRPGLLAGLPIGVKDIIDTADMPTGHGSPIYRGNRPFADAACVALLRMAGGTIMGKTVTTEFANRFPGRDRQPAQPGAHARAARRAARPPRSPISRSRRRSARRPAAR